MNKNSEYTKSYIFTFTSAMQIELIMRMLIISPLNGLPDSSGLAILHSIEILRHVFHRVALLRRQRAMFTIINGALTVLYLPRNSLKYFVSSTSVIANESWLFPFSLNFVLLSRQCADKKRSIKAFHGKSVLILIQVLLSNVS